MLSDIAIIPTPPLTYADTFKGRIIRLLAQVTYPSLEFQVEVKDRAVSLRVHCPGGTCNVTGEKWSWNGRWWRLSPHMTDSEVVATAFKAVLTALEHEARESFKFKGQAVYDSHLSVHQLAQLSADRKARDTR